MNEIKAHNAMSPEEQRIAIAEACGYMQPHYTPSGDCVASEYEKGEGSFWGSRGVPDYLNDLNACREFEEVLNSPKYMQFHAFNNYAATLCEMCKHEYNAIAATAPQRCEAFLKTIDRWKE